MPPHPAAEMPSTASLLSFVGLEAKLNGMSGSIIGLNFSSEDIAGTVPPWYVFAQLDQGYKAGNMLCEVSQGLSYIGSIVPHLSVANVALVGTNNARAFSAIIWSKGLFELLQLESVPYRSTAAVHSIVIGSVRGLSPFM